MIASKENIFKKVLMAAVMLIMLLWALNLYAVTAEYVIRPEVEIASDKISFKDILTDESLSNLNHDLNVLLGNSPAPGKSRKISRSFIVMRLKNSSVNTSQLVLEGSNYVTVKRKAYVVPVEQIKRAATEFIKKKYDLLDQKMIVEIKNLKNDIYLPGKNYKIAVSETGRAGNKSNISLKMEFTLEGKLNACFKKNIVATALLEKEVVVSSRSTSPGKEFNSNNVELVKKNVALFSSYCDSLDALKGKVSRSYIGAGQIIGADLLEQKMLIRKKDFVSATIRKGAMNVSLKLRAVEDGSLDDEIRLFNPLNREYYYGIVIGPDKVKVNI